MSTKYPLKEEHKSEIKERSEEELLEEEIKNQQTLDCFIESEKNWNWLKTHLLGDIYEFKKTTIFNPW